MLDVRRIHVQLERSDHRNLMLLKLQRRHGPARKIVIHAAILHRRPVANRTEWQAVFRVRRRKQLAQCLHSVEDTRAVGSDDITLLRAKDEGIAFRCHFSAEAEIAKYGKPGKETRLILFSYPTMEMARDRIAHFQQVPGAVVKRAGPLVAVALNPASPDEAERLLSKIKYQAEVTLPEHVPTESLPPDT